MWSTVNSRDNTYVLPSFVEPINLNNTFSDQRQEWETCLAYLNIFKWFSSKFELFYFEIIPWSSFRFTLMWRFTCLLFKNVNTFCFIFHSSHHIRNDIQHNMPTLYLNKKNFQIINNGCLQIHFKITIRAFKVSD